MPLARATTAPWRWRRSRTAVRAPPAATTRHFTRRRVLDTTQVTFGVRPRGPGGPVAPVGPVAPAGPVEPAGAGAPGGARPPRTPCGALRARGFRQPADRVRVLLGEPQRSVGAL